MKTTDRLLLHSLDTVTPGGLNAARRARRALLWAVFITATHGAAFIVGFVAGRV